MDRREARFWEQTLNFDWDTISTNREERSSAERKLRAQIRRLRIIASHFFIGKEQIVMSILLNSANPAEDVGSCLNVTHPEAYRVIYYVKAVVRELVWYFDKGTYKEVQASLQHFLTDKEYAIFALYSVSRSAAITAKALGYSSAAWMRLTIKKMDKKLKDLAYKYEAYKDLFITWRRISKLRKVSYNKRVSLKNDYIHTPELKSYEHKTDK